MSKKRTGKKKPRRRAELRERLEAMIREGELWGRRLPGYRDLARQWPRQIEMRDGQVTDDRRNS